MKNIFILLIFISNVTYSQSFTELSDKYYVLSEDNKFWKDSIVSETKFEISSKAISYVNGKIKNTFRVISSDDGIIIDEGDKVFRAYCVDSKNKEVEIIFMTSKENERYIYVLSDYEQLSFNIN